LLNLNRPCFDLRLKHLIANAQLIGFVDPLRPHGPKSWMSLLEFLYFLK